MIKKYVDFQVGEMKEPFNTFQALLGLRWFVNANGLVDPYKKDISFADDNSIVRILLVDLEDTSYVEEIMQ